MTENKFQNFKKHFYFWFILWIVLSFAYPMSETDIQNAYYESFVRQLFFLISKIALTYWSIYFLFPRYFATKKYYQFGLFFLLSLAVITLAQRAFNLYIYYLHIYPLFGGSVDSDLKFWQYTYLIQTALLIYPPAIIALFITALSQWYNTQQKLKESEKEQLYSELKFLQAQIHPHFFFNTLNNLYGLALAKSDIAPELILKLSDIMRYMLYETSGSNVSLQKEIQHLHNYIELEKVRYKENFDIFFKQRGNIEDARIAPLLLLPLVENAFKHGFSESVYNAWISIDLQVEKNIIHFKVENSIPKLDHKPVNGNSIKNGLGVENISRRLQLLYKNKHHFSTSLTEEKYTAQLDIENLN